MDCQELREDLVAYLDRELSGEATQRVEAHLAHCPRCAEEARFFERSWELLERYEGVRPPLGFLESVLQRLAREEAGRPAGAASLSGLRRLAPYLAAAALLGVALWAGRAFLAGRTPPEPSAPVARLTEEERAIVQDLPILASKQFELLRDLKLVEHYPVLSSLSENDFEAL